MVLLKMQVKLGYSEVISKVKAKAYPVQTDVYPNMRWHRIPLSACTAQHTKIVDSGFFVAPPPFPSFPLVTKPLHLGLTLLLH